MKVLIVYYSVHLHIHRMAEPVAEGVREVKGAEVEMRSVPRPCPKVYSNFMDDSNQRTNSGRTNQLT